MLTWSSELLSTFSDYFRNIKASTYVMSVFKGKEMNGINNARDPQEARRGFLNP